MGRKPEVAFFVCSGSDLYLRPEANRVCVVHDCCVIGLIDAGYSRDCAPVVVDVLRSGEMTDP